MIQTQAQTQPRRGLDLHRPLMPHWVCSVMHTDGTVFTKFTTRTPDRETARVRVAATFNVSTDFVLVRYDGNR